MFFLESTKFVTFWPVIAHLCLTMAEIRFALVLHSIYQNNFTFLILHQGVKDFFFFLNKHQYSKSFLTHSWESNTSNTIVLYCTCQRLSTLNIHQKNKLKALTLLKMTQHYWRWTRTSDLEAFHCFKSVNYFILFNQVLKSKNRERTSTLVHTLCMHDIWLMTQEQSDVLMLFTVILQHTNSMNFFFP